MSGLVGCGARFKGFSVHGGNQCPYRDFVFWLAIVFLRLGRLFGFWVFGRVVRFGAGRGGATG